jgi:hypothetical protein
VAATFCLCALAVVLLPRLLPASAWRETMRDWWPAVYLLLGYWLSGYYFIRPMPDVEQRFLAVDRWLYASRTLNVVAHLRFGLELLELAYLGCFVFVPGGMAMLGSRARRRRPLLDARAHRRIRVVRHAAVDSDAAAARHRAARDHRRSPAGVSRHQPGDGEEHQHRVQHLSERHVAGSLAVALAVSEAVPAATIPMLVGAALISVSTVIGRYHYAVDAVAGVVLTLVAWAIMQAVR